MEHIGCRLEMFFQRWNQNPEQAKRKMLWQKVWGLDTNALSGHRFVGSTLYPYEGGSYSLFCFFFSLSWTSWVSTSPEWSKWSWVAAHHFGSWRQTLMGWDGNQQQRACLAVAGQGSDSETSKARSTMSGSLSCRSRAAPAGTMPSSPCLKEWVARPCCLSAFLLAGNFSSSSK